MEALNLVGTDVSVWRGDREILHAVNFSLPAGEALILRGANGCGKTTLLRTVAGFLSPAQGRILIDGDDDLPVSAHCQYVGHLNGIKAVQTVEETLTFYTSYFNADVAGQTVHGKVDEAMERLNLTALANVPSGYLSAGQQRRLGLARLVCGSRPIWILDEPTTSLDHGSADLLVSLVNDHLSDGGLALIATHLDLDIVPSNLLQLDRQSAPA